MESYQNRSTDYHGRKRCFHKRYTNSGRTEQLHAIMEERRRTLGHCGALHAYLSSGRPMLFNRVVVPSDTRPTSFFVFLFESQFRCLGTVLCSMCLSFRPINDRFPCRSC